MQVVRVERGDTLLGIARRYNISEKELVQENGAWTGKKAGPTKHRSTGSS